MKGKRCEYHPIIWLNCLHACVCVRTRGLGALLVITTVPTHALQYAQKVWQMAIDCLHTKSRTAETERGWYTKYRAGRRRSWLAWTRSEMASGRTIETTTSSDEVGEGAPDSSWTVKQLWDYLQRRNGQLTSRKNNLLQLWVRDCLARFTTIYV